MRLNKKLYLSLICLLTFLICSISGCIPNTDDDFVFDNKYNAEIIGIGENSDDYDWSVFFTEKFWSESRTLGCRYKNEDYVPGDPEWLEYIEDTTSPRSRTYIISNRQEFDETFAEDCFSDYKELDYEKYMLVVYMSKGFYHKGTALRRVELEDKHLTIEYYVKKEKTNTSIFNKHYLNTPAPGRLWIVVKMDKLDVDTAEIVSRNL